MTDTEFEVGQTCMFSVHFDYGTCELRPESQLSLDSIYGFLMRNKQLVVEVGYHWDNRPPHEWSLGQTFTKCRADALVKRLRQMGVKKNRLLARGYEQTQPLISIEVIDKMKSDEEKERAWQTNRRVELKILKTLSQ